MYTANMKTKKDKIGYPDDIRRISIEEWLTYETSWSSVGRLVRWLVCHNKKKGRGKLQYHGVTCIGRFSWLERVDRKSRGFSLQTAESLKVDLPQFFNASHHFTFDWQTLLIIWFLQCISLYFLDSTQLSCHHFLFCFSNIYQEKQR